MMSEKSNTKAIENSRVEDWMRQKDTMVSAEPDTTLRHASEIMKEAQLESLPITENGRLLGIITQGTIERYLPSRSPTPTPSSWQLNQAIKQTAVGNIMNDNPMTLSPEAPLKLAAKMMLAEQVETIPVVNINEELVGIIRLQDILHMLSRS